MTRSITTRVTTEIAKNAVSPIMLVKLEFDSGDALVWSGMGNLTWDSQTWLGIGNLGKISRIDETADIQADGIKLELSGIPSDYISLALTENYQGRACTVWVGFMDGEAVIENPTQMFSGRMDLMAIDERGDTSTLVISAENHLADLLKPREWRYTHEDQQIDYPGDLGLEMIASVQNKEYQWGPS